MKKPIIFVGFLVLGVTLGTTIALLAPEPSVRKTIEWLDNPRSVQTFNLGSDPGSLTNQSLKGQWTIVSFGFLHCPDVCPTSLTQLARLSEALSEESAIPNVEFVFVSVDPGRDSPADVSQYVRHFDDAFIGATGKEGQLAKFAGSLGVQFKVSSDVNDYKVAHSITHSIIGPDGLLHGRFRPGSAVQALVQNLRTKLEEDDVLL